MFAGVKKKPRVLFIPEEHLVKYKNGYVLQGEYIPVMTDTYQVLAYSDPGFYRGWGFMLYMTLSKGVFMTDACSLAQIEVRRDTGILVWRYTNTPVQFTRVSPENLYSELFLP